MVGRHRSIALHAGVCRLAPPWTHRPAVQLHAALQVARRLDHLVQHRRALGALHMVCGGGGVLTRVPAMRGAWTAIDVAGELCDQPGTLPAASSR